MLCHCVTKANRSRYERQLDQMYAQRHEVFVDQLGWRELRRPDGLDIDAYDTEDTAYFLVLNDEDEVVASARMNPTWGRHQMEAQGELRRRFVHLKPPSGPTIWEGSRLLGGRPERFGKAFARATLGVILAGLQEFCVRRGVTQGISIFETRALSRVQDLGWETEPLGLPVRYDTDRGEAEAQATIWRTGIRYLAQTRLQTGVKGPILFEAAPSLEDSDAETPVFALLETAAALRTQRQQAEALRAMRALMVDADAGGLPSRSGIG